MLLLVDVIVEVKLGAYYPYGSGKIIVEGIGRFNCELRAIIRTIIKQMYGKRLIVINVLFTIG